MLRSTVFCLIILAGCSRLELIDPDAGNCEPCKTQCPPAPDLRPPAAKCAAAMGLAGENLLCVDFDKVSKLSDLTGWDFTSFCPTGWDIVGSKLQVKNFGTFASSCIFTLPALPAADYQKYGSFTLSVVHSVDLNETRQKIQVMLGLDDPTMRLIDQTTGVQPRKQWVHTLARTALPNGGTNTYQPLFKLTSSMGSGGQGWQIESIAIQGGP